MSSSDVSMSERDETRGWFRRRIVDPVVALLKQGATPEAIALSMAIGALVGIFPILGTTTVILLVIGFVFRLNPVALQILNYVAYPFQLALIIPFIRLGERLFHVQPLPLSLDQLVTLFKGGTLHAIAVVWRSLMYASAAWLLVGPIGIVALYFVLLPIVRRAARMYGAAHAQAGAPA